MSTFLSDRFDSAVGENLIGHVADTGGAWLDYNLLTGWVDGNHYIGSGGGRILFGIDRGVARSPAVPGNAFGQYDLICFHNGGGDGAAALFARMSATEATGYMVAHEEAFGSPVLQLRRYDNNVIAGISTSKAMAGWTTPKTLSIKMEDLGGGTHRISALVDGVVELSFDDPSPIAGPGFVLVGGRNGNGADLIANDTVVSSSLTGNITADDSAPTGSIAPTPPSGLSGNLTADDAVASGALSPVVSSVTTLPASRNPGNGARLVSIANVALAVLTDDANLARLNGSASLNMGSDGRLVFANGVPVAAGTSVVVVTRLPGANGALGVERYITA